MVATESPHTLHTRGFYRTRTWWRDKNQPRKEIPNLTDEELFTDGGPWQEYTGPIRLEKTARVAARVWVDGGLKGELCARFCRGAAPVYVDRAHGNEEVLGELPPGPFLEKITGRWRLADGGGAFCFEPDGTVFLEAGGQRQKLGGWWYDFPVDWLEAQGYAGTGEIWFCSGERQPIRLTSQAADRLEMDNRQLAFSTEFSRQEHIQLERMEDTP